MINRASVQLWGRVGQTAGPPKWGGRKSDTWGGDRRSCATFFGFYLHKEFRAAGIRILFTQRIGGGDLEENDNFLYENALRNNF